MRFARSTNVMCCMLLMVSWILLETISPTQARCSIFIKRWKPRCRRLMMRLMRMQLNMKLNMKMSMQVRMNLSRMIKKQSLKGRTNVLRMRARKESRRNRRSLDASQVCELLLRRREMKSLYRRQRREHEFMAQCLRNLSWRFDIDFTVYRRKLLRSHQSRSKTRRPENQTFVYKNPENEGRYLILLSLWLHSSN